MRSRVDASSETRIEEFLCYSRYLYNVFIVRHVHHVAAPVKGQIEHVGSRELGPWQKRAGVNSHQLVYQYFLVRALH